MDAYRVVLFLHLCALLAAFGTGVLLHHAQGRMLAATTLDELRPWALLIARRGIVFPMALLVLFATGGYLVHHSWSWRIGWVEASICGVALLLLSGGGIVGRSSRHVARRVTSPDATDAEVTTLARRPAPHVASWVNTGLALAITFVMVDKPSLASSIAILLAGVGLGAATALASLRFHARLPIAWKGGDTA